MAMNFVILRTQKLKAGCAVRRSLLHAFRVQDTPNADPSRTPDNTHIGASSVDEALAKFNARLPSKLRSNAVLGIEYLITASPDAMNNKNRAHQDMYFDDALSWLREKHGAENVVYAGIHRDEKTPHMYAYVVPIDKNGKLNCRAFLGGSKALSSMQTEFAEKVGRHHDLARGVTGTKARHQEVKKFYAHLKQPIEHMAVTPEMVSPRVVKKGFFQSEYETPETVAERLTLEIQKRYEPIAQKASQSDLNRARSEEFAQLYQGTETQNRMILEGAESRERILKPFVELRFYAQDEFEALKKQVARRVEQLKQRNKPEPSQTAAPHSHQPEHDKQNEDDYDFRP